MFKSKHNPAGGATLHCDNGRIESLIANYQAIRDLESLAAIVSLTQDRALTFIRFRKAARYRSEAELMSDINLRLMQAIDRFNPEKSSAFSYLSQTILNCLCTSVSIARRNAKQYVKLSKRAADTLRTNGETESGFVVADLTHRIKTSARTTLTDPVELSAQRWYIESFIDGAFELRRHQCADAAMAVYGLSHSRSRELYDLTILEVRRVMYDSLPARSPVAAGRLVGTRGAWMARYRPLLSETEFTKFVILTKNLSPFVLLLIDPENRSRRQDRNPAITRKNIEFILNGHPHAGPLF
jgi:hypothetical protein